MTLEFTSPHGWGPGTILRLLTESYADLVSSDPETWGPEVRGWEEFDQDIFRHPETVGSSIFLSLFSGRLVGCASYDPRRGPEMGVVGHNCILPPFRNRGFGAEQIHEVLRIFDKLRIERARVTTLDHPFFEPARRMYVGCGFRETGRTPWERNRSYARIEYERKVR